MGKIRHIAIQVPDLEKAAGFYEGVFGLTRVGQVESPVGNAISLSDGTMNLTLLHFPEGTKGGPDWAGLHHIGFVDDEASRCGARSRVIVTPARAEGSRYTRAEATTAPRMTLRSCAMTFVARWIAVTAGSRSRSAARRSRKTCVESRHCSQSSNLA
jgi:catechol 2,3-dioxygenase-like lactoylglutathione lyase family enzyme